VNHFPNDVFSLKIAQGGSLYVWMAKSTWSFAELHGRTNGQASRERLFVEMKTKEVIFKLDNASLTVL